MENIDKPEKQIIEELKNSNRDFSELSHQKNDLEEKLKSLILDNVVDPIFVHDLQGNFIYVNQNACKSLGYTKDELMKLNLHDLVIPQFEQIITPRIKELETKKELKFQTAYFRKDGSILPLEIHARIIEFHNEKLIFSIAKDITNYKRIVEAIKEREKHLSLITDNMLDLIYQVNKKGIFEYVSPSLKDLLGYEVEDVIGKKDIELIKIVHPDDLNIIINAIQTAIATLKPKRIQHRYKHADGHYIWVETIGNPLSNEKGEFSGAVYITRDIQELKRIENQLKSSLEEKEVLLKEIHHRVKNNMQIISSLLNLQSKCLKDENAIRILKESRDRVKSMAIVHEKLYQSDNFSRINFAEYIKKLLYDLLSSYGINSKFIKQKINVENILLDINFAIPCGLIINELVSNSIKHAFPNGRGEIGVEFYLKSNKHILIIADNGVGFPEYLDFQNTETLGLRLVNALVTQLYGKIELYRDEGTTFKIIF
ncbi:MAG: PAS domain S-box protein [Methanobacterium sp.]|nr:PAS domain S-box protein [Methanobacterium sp.]